MNFDSEGTFVEQGKEAKIECNKESPASEGNDVSFIKTSMTEEPKSIDAWDGGHHFGKVRLKPFAELAMVNSIALTPTTDSSLVKVRKATDNQGLYIQANRSTSIKLEGGVVLESQSDDLEKSCPNWNKSSLESQKPHYSTSRRNYKETQVEQKPALYFQIREEPVDFPLGSINFPQAGDVPSFAIPACRPNEAVPSSLIEADNPTESKQDIKVDCSLLDEVKQSANAQSNGSAELMDIVKPEIDFGINADSAKLEDGLKVYPQIKHDDGQNRVKSRKRKRLMTERDGDIDLPCPPSNPIWKFGCEACYYKTDVYRNLSAHIKSFHSAENKFCCLCCSRTNKSLSHLIHHFGTVHLQETRWQCEKCGVSWKQQESYDRHKAAQCSADGPFSCFKCRFGCDSELLLFKHIKETHGITELATCDYCGVIFKSSELSLHISYCQRKESHSELSESNADSRSKLPSMVTRPVTSTRPRSFQARGIRLRICDYGGCGKKFYTMKKFLFHVKSHWGQDSRSYCKLEICRATFPDSQSLADHYQLTHHDWLYECVKCSTRFQSKLLLGRHIRFVHDEELVGNQGSKLAKKRAKFNCYCPKEEKIDADEKCEVKTDDGLHVGERQNGDIVIKEESSDWGINGKNELAPDVDCSVQIKREIDQ